MNPFADLHAGGGVERIVPQEVRMPRALGTAHGGFECFAGVGFHAAARAEEIHRDDLAKGHVAGAKHLPVIAAGQFVEQLEAVGDEAADRGGRRHLTAS